MANGITEFEGDRGRKLHVTVMRIRGKLSAQVPRLRREGESPDLPASPRDLPPVDLDLDALGL